jgi:hypothetical protein
LLFGWSRLGLLSKARLCEKLATGGSVDPNAILDHVRSRMPGYLDDVDQGRLVYPACRRATGDSYGDIQSVWEHTRLEAMRYLMLVPGADFKFLVASDYQVQMMSAYLRQRAHADTVVDYTGDATADFAIAVIAGLNWLTHCAKVAGVPPNAQTRAISNFRRLIVLADHWWSAEGAIQRSRQLPALEMPAPVMIYLVWSEYTRLSKQIAGAAILGQLATTPDLVRQFESAQDPTELPTDIGRYTTT